ncbi:MAG TPA: hypothetical protein VJN18_01770 [Polyangiaceae bacterium]|nr:hypothetical protein [Polyangiaceae bacterium]
MLRLLEIQEPEKSPERLELVHRLACVLRAGRRVMLPAKDCPSESHLFHIEPTDDGALLEVPKNVPGTFLFNGVTLRTGLVPWGGEVFWEQSRLTFLREAKAKKPSPVVLLGAIAMLLLVGFGVAKGAPDKSPPGVEVEAPALAAKPQLICPDTDPAMALRRGREAERAARVKREQFAFELADGAIAMSLFAEAGACYAAAGLADDRARVEADLDAWSQRVGEHYAAARLRLQLARDQGRAAEALSAVRELQRLLRGSSGPYIDWLEALRRDLELQQRRAGS